jgi:hypothetical protein
MKKLLKLGAALVVLSLLFAGCPPADEPEPPPAAPTITRVTLVVTPGLGVDPDDSTKLGLSANLGERTFSATVDGTGTFDAGYRIEFFEPLLFVPSDPPTTPPSLVSIEGDLDDMIVVTDGTGNAKIAVALDTAPIGSFRVRAVSTANEAIVSAPMLVHVGLTYSFADQAPPAPNFADAAWVIRNLNPEASLNASTTRTLPAPVNNRYVIFNNEPNAMVESRSGTSNEASNPYIARGVRGVTYMYLDQPFIADARPTYFRSYGMEARVRITADADGATAWNVARGLFIAAFTDPSAYEQQLGADNLIKNPEDIPEAVGVRIGSHGQVRGWHSRVRMDQALDKIDFGGITIPQAGGIEATTNPNIPGTNPGVAWFAALGESDFQGNNPANGPSTAANAVDGFRDQEFVYRITRHSMTVWIIHVLDRTGTTVLARTAVYANSPSPGIISNVPHYFGFIISGVKAEISDVKFFHNLTPNLNALVQVPAWVDPAVKDAVPTVPEAKRVTITTATTGGTNADGVNLTLVYDDVTESFILNSSIIPMTTNQAVTWSVEGEGTDVLTVEATAGAGRVTKAGVGKATVLATPVAGGAVGRFTIEFLGGPIVPTGIKIETDVATIIGGTNHPRLTSPLTVAGVPAGAIIEDPVTWSITAGEAAASIDEKTGVVTAAATVATRTTVTVKAVSGTFEDTFDIVVRPTNEIWRWTTGDDWPIAAGTEGNDEIHTIDGIPVVKKGGQAFKHTETGNLVLLGGGRFTLGLDSTSNTTATAHVAGELDLSTMFKITVTYTSFSNTASATHKYPFQVIFSNSAGNTSAGVVVYNGTTDTITTVNATRGNSTSNDVNPEQRFVNHGANADSLLMRAHAPLDGGDTISITVNPANLVLRAGVTAHTLEDAISTAFLQFRMENAATTINISSIVVEYAPAP